MYNSGPPIERNISDIAGHIPKVQKGNQRGDEERIYVADINFIKMFRGRQASLTQFRKDYLKL
jgi:hypothetical protein